MPLLDFGVDGWTFRCYRRKLALVSTGIRPGMVTVALRSWQFNCWPTRPSRRGSVRLRVNATCVRNPQTSFFQASRNCSVTRAADCSPSRERAISKISVTSRAFFNGRDPGSPSFLVSAF